MKNRILYTTIFLASTLLAKAQSSVQNNGVLYVAGSTDILYINGTLTNASAGNLTNNGNLYILQNISNAQVSMPVGTGRLWLTGTSAQDIGGAQPFRTFNLTTSNAAGITLNSNLHVSGAHNFVSGVIATSATPNYLIYEAGASHIGSSNGAHVSGWVKKLGNTAFTFPVGTASFLRSVALSNLSASSEFNVRHNITTPNTGSYAAPLMVINPGEYWTINRISGGTAQATLNWNNPAISFFQHWLVDYRVAYDNAGTWMTMGGSATGNPLTTGSITSNVITNFGSFGFGSVNAEILPVDFVSIQGFAKQGYNLVQWKTNDEFNIAHFDVQRSIDGNTFVKIGEQSPNNTPGIHDYEFRDINMGTAWYRIKNVDLDGRSEYSPVVRIAPMDNAAGLRVINTLVTDKIIVSGSGADKGDYQYTLTGSSGQTVQKGKFVLNGAGINTISINGRIPSGTYVLYLFNNKQQLVEKIMVK
jgi:hypothetical protein